MPDITKHLTIGYLYKWLTGLLQRRYIDVRIVAGAGSEAIASEIGMQRFKATNENPTILITALTGNTFTAGTYYLEGTLTRHVGSRVAFIKTGTDSEQLLPTTLNGNIKEVFELLEPSSSILIKASNRNGLFEITRFQLSKISAIESLARKLARIAYDYWRFRKADITTLRPAALLSLSKAYESTAQQRIAYCTQNKYTSIMQRFHSEQNKLNKSAIRPDRQRIAVAVIYSENDESNIRQTLRSIDNQTFPASATLQIQCPKGALSNGGTSFLQSKNSSNDIWAELLEKHNFDYILFLQSGDTIDKTLLHAVVDATKYVNYDLIYTDHDTTTDGESTKDAMLKPCWNIDLLLSNNYIRESIIISRKLIKNHKENPRGTINLYELILRSLTSNPEISVHHISGPFFHKKNRPDSKNLLNEVAREEEIILQLKDKLRIESIEKTQHPQIRKIVYQAEKKSCSIIIPTRNQYDLLRKCIESIQATAKAEDYELIVVDNQSDDPKLLHYLEDLQNSEQAKILKYDAPFNYSAINNHAAQMAAGEFLIFLNNDIEVLTRDWIQEVLMHAQRDNIGAVGVRLVYPDLTIQHCGVVIGLGGVAGHIHRFEQNNSMGICGRIQSTMEVTAVTGACLIISKINFLRVNGFDADHFPVAYNDIDLCLKLRQVGLKIIYDANVTMIHHESVSRGRDNNAEKRQRFQRETHHMKAKWKTEGFTDPFYNKYLTIQYEDPTITY